MPDGHGLRELRDELAFLQGGITAIFGCWHPLAAQGGTGGPEHGNVKRTKPGQAAGHRQGIDPRHAGNPPFESGNRPLRVGSGNSPEGAGYNEVAEKRGHPVLDFLRKFWGISAWMLELIMVLSAALGKYSDLAVVGALLVVNAVLGYAQERRAAGVVEALRKRLQVNARVLRESAWKILPARELVPGDIVRLRSGDIVPADVKLLAGNLTVDQSALTGESKDADKATGEVVPSGSIVRRGEGTGVVMLTGAKTLFGRTTQLVQEARPKLHIEAVVSKVVRWLFVIVGILLCVVAALSVVRGTCRSWRWPPSSWCC